jgi:hypothetical protein
MNQQRQKVIPMVINSDYDPFLLVTRYPAIEWGDQRAVPALPFFAIERQRVCRVTLGGKSPALVVLWLSRFE